MSRKTDRKHIFNLIYQLEFYAHDTREAADDMVCRYFDVLDRPEGIDRDFVVGEFMGTLENLAEIDGRISECAEGWELYRFSKVDLAIMRLAVYEIVYAGDIPEGVSVNEAVELAKQYSADESPAFVNGILGKVIKLDE